MEKHSPHILFSKENTAIQHEKLGKLLKKYPYSLNLQYKYLESAIALGQTIDKADFKRLSVFAIDKPFFKLKFRKLAKLESEQATAENSDHKEVVRANLETQQEETMLSTEEANLIDDNPVKQIENEQTFIMAPNKEEKKSANQAPEALRFEEWLDSLKKSKRLTEIEVEQSTSLISKKKKKAKKKKKKAKKKYEKYVEFGTKQDEIISETLAELMAKQGYTDKAIEMYNRLSLLFPDKNSYFARKIEELQ